MENGEYSDLILTKRLFLGALSGAFRGCHACIGKDAKIMSPANDAAVNA
jgi:hypothetical protein